MDVWVFNILFHFKKRMIYHEILIQNVGPLFISAFSNLWNSGRMMQQNWPPRWRGGRAFASQAEDRGSIPGWEDLRR